MYTGVKDLRFNIVFILFTLGRHFNGVTFADDTDVALEVALGATGNVVRVRQQGPLVVELVI